LVSLDVAVLSARHWFVK